MAEPTSNGTRGTTCALEGCEVPVVQPAGGGRRRLYCTNAHRAEAGRRRLGTTPTPPATDVLGASLDRLAAVVDDLNRHRAALVAVDPNTQAAGAARLRAETTAQVLAAQQSAAESATDAARARDELEAQRAAGQQGRERYEAELDELRGALATARENATAAQDAFEQAGVAHADEIQQREQAAAKAAACHEAEAAELLGELEGARTAMATAEARAEAADGRAAHSDAARQRAIEKASKTERQLAQAHVEMATARAAADAATLRADGLAERLGLAEAALEVERERHDARFAQLQEQLAQLVAQRPAPRATTRAKKKPVATPTGRHTGTVR